MAKIVPTVLTIPLAIPTPAEPATTNLYADCGQITSVVNRRFMRQGLTWAIDGFTLIVNGTAVGFMNITSLQNTWMQFNAWQKAYSAWQKQEKTAMKEAGLLSTVAKYRDFKIHFDNTHVTAGFAANLRPQDATLIAPYLQGEWDASQIVIPNDGGVAGNTVEYVLHMHGNDTAGSKALIENYQESRAAPFSPDPNITDPEDSFYSQMVDLGEIQEEVVVNATDRNNDLPYTETLYPGGVSNAPTGQYVSGITLIPGQNIRRHLRLGGGTFPCGLIKIEHNLSDANPAPSLPHAVLLCHMVPGEHRGYMALPMKEF